MVSDKTEYKLSVRLMTYMHEPYIKDAMEGIMMQKTNFKVEVVVGDDFSTDGTLDVVKKYKDTEDIHIKILEREKGDDYWVKRQKLGRLYNFVNILENCSGKYIALLDGDDYWTDPLKLQKQVDFLEGNEDFAGIFHSSDIIDERNPNYKSKPWRTYNQDVFKARDTIRKLSLFHTSSYCFRNLEFDLEYLFTKHLMSADMMLLGLISKFGQLKLIDVTMSVYRKNEGGVTSSESKIKYHRNRIALNKALNKYFDYKYSQRAMSVIKYHKDQIFKIKYPKIYTFKKKIKSKLS